jgi:DNA polymerase-3 subunit epsilon
VEALPEGPGVYIFEDDEGAPLYVGKSVTVRRRVMSHFAADYGRGAELKMAQAVRKLRAIPTHGELSALILESDMVKDLQPQYNRQLRQKELMTLVLGEVSPEGYATVRLADAREIAPDQATDLLAIYTTQGRAKTGLQALVATYRLCPKLMGLERTNRACFLSQLGKCDRACEGAEAPEDYNERFAYAFERQRVAVWPYPGPVLIREQQPGLEGSAGYVVDGWCMTARLREFDDGSVEVTPELRRFDLDRYKIIRNFLANPRNRRAVTMLNQAQLRELAGAAANLA